MSTGTAIRTVLFDLDGTLADTAPDLATALNTVLREQGCEPMHYEQIRPVVSHGGIALIRLGFGLGPGDANFESLRQRLLQVYRENIAVHTRLFDGMAELLAILEQRGLNWGVVTNKPAWLTIPLMDELGLRERAATIVSGDTLKERKPHPAPMLLACEQAGSQPSQCLYVGDAERDIQAGLNAGMTTLLALFGYIDKDDAPQRWGAHALIESPMDIVEFIDQPPLQVS